MPHMPPVQQVDVELHQGEFLELNDLTGPLEVEVVNNSKNEHDDLRFSLNLSNNASTDGSVGLMAQPHFHLDLIFLGHN